MTTVVVAIEEADSADFHTGASLGKVHLGFERGAFSTPSFRLVPYSNRSRNNLRKMALSVLDGWVHTESPPQPPRGTPIAVDTATVR